MSWLALLAVFFGSLILLMVARVPVAFALFAVNIIAAVAFFGLQAGMRQIVLGIEGVLTSYVLIPVVLFVLMGEVLFRSGTARDAVSAIDKFVGKVRGRLAVLTTATGALFGILSGSTIASTAVLGTTLLPDMRDAGYSERLAMGSILASGGLAMIIPPSAMVVIWGATADVPIGPLLIAGLIPGVLMALGYLVVIGVWSYLRDGAPVVTHDTSYAPDVAMTKSREMRSLLVDVLPLFTVIVAVLGSIFMGIATTTESSALGALAAFAIVAGKGALNRNVIAVSLAGTARVCSMIFLVLAGSGAYSQMMGYSGAIRGASTWVTGLNARPLILLAMMMILVIVLGFFIDQIATMLITLPFFMPIVIDFGWDPIWFGIVMLIFLQIGITTPPFGLSLFVMKGVAPTDTRLMDIYASAVPFVLSDIVVATLLIFFPLIVTWLPSVM